MRISFVVNVHRPDAIEAAKLAGTQLAELGSDVFAEQSVADLVQLPSATRTEIQDSDLVIAFGGDGTLIRAAHICSERGTPILGVYFGRFGFVTQCKPEEIVQTVKIFVKQEHLLESRMMLETNLVRNGETIATVHTLNESVLQRTVTDRMLTFDVEINGQLLTRYPADGVMVSTPTGSTGYNLSAGGPVVDPSVQAMTLTALAPHTLSARPLVLGPQSLIGLRLEEGGDAVLSGDGQTRLHLLSGDSVQIKKSPRSTNLVTIRTTDFLEKLRHRLFWSRSILENEND